MRKVLTRKLQAFAARRSERMAVCGRRLEEEIEKYLKELQTAGQVKDFIYHTPNSREDGDGRDFSVRRRIGDELVEKTFGVTISLRSWNEGRRLHPGIVQFCFPIGTKKETIIKKIFSLF